MSHPLMEHLLYFEQIGLSVRSAVLGSFSESLTFIQLNVINDQSSNI